ncbi:class I SAM-dependent methyltransferase [Candidatus Daviesbacteria bacterium]|nr:class I SAM-dependent methyltransferase [Candidatus Daviesbacteria bacterium]
MSNPVCPNCKNNKDISKLIFAKNLYICNLCNNGFLFPIEKNLSRFYPASYWKYPGQLSFIRSGLHNLLQYRRKKWLIKYLKRGAILDVGAGEGVFGKILGSDYQITNLESPFAEISNKNTIKVDFLAWKTNQRFDGIVFLESLEHVPGPQEYLKKAQSLLKKGGYIFVECPRFDSWEAKFFKDKWLHLDLPRHLVHLTRGGLATLASRSKLKVVSQKGMLVYEFSSYCFTVSLMHLLKIKPLNLREKSISNFTSILLALVLLPVGFIFETILHLFDQDPVQLSVFQKQ